MDVPTVLEPLKTAADRLPDALFNVVLRVLGPAPATCDRPGIAAYYARLLDDTLTVRTALAALFAGGSFEPGGPKSDKENLNPGATKLLAPFVRMQLLGRHVEAAARAVPAGVTVEISGHPVHIAQRIDFDPRKLAARVIAEPLATKVYALPDAAFDVIVEFQTHDTPDTAEARQNVVNSLEILHDRAPDVVLYRISAHNGHPYIFATLSGEAVVALVELDRNRATGPPMIFRIWEDTAVTPLICVSLATVKADAAHIAYSALGKRIVWAVLDSGIDQTHPHFRHYKNLLTLPQQVKHRDYTRDVTTKDAGGNDTTALVDEFGHGTHVAGIIAGALGTGAPFTDKDAAVPVALTSVRNESGSFTTTLHRFEETNLSGMAPACTLVSYRVLDEKGLGKASSIIEAITDIRLINSAANRPIIHGVNLSVGYPFDAEWFACGQSPLCVEIDRLVKSGVVVVAAAGNSGYGVVSTSFTGARAEGIGMSINDPGNAELAITVGSVHREEPHTYGMSYFSSKGPTGDGRLKPDLVAPGERIISCASTQARSAMTVVDASGASKEIAAADYTYKEDSGTSMAAPHVSGVIAGFLSIRREFIGQPENVKRLFMDNATDLKRDRNYQGRGLVDPMRVISSI
jgi:subtilisin family serine protease